MGGVDEGARKGGRRQLTPELIVRTALELVDRTGLEGLTMRKLGAALEVDAMAVYTYFDSKAALLDAVVEHEAARLREVSGPLPSDPIELMLHVARHYRRVLLDHPNLAPLLASRPLPQHEAPAIIQFGVGLFQDAGFQDEDIPVATDAMVTFILGFILQEAGRAQRRMELGDDFNSQQDHLRQRLAELPMDTTIAEQVVARRLRDDATLEEFETGMRAMLNGYRLGLGRPPEPA